MNQSLVKYVAIEADGCTEIRAQTFFEKQDSHTFSVFQRIGLRYLMLDALIAFNSNISHLAQAFFTITLVEDGWSGKNANQLLAQVGSERRMYTTWCLMDDSERTAAKELDYDVLQNFWPNLDFIADGFSDQVEGSACDLPASVH